MKNFQSNACQKINLPILNKSTEEIESNIKNNYTYDNEDNSSSVSKVNDNCECVLANKLKKGTIKNRFKWSYLLTVYITYISLSEEQVILPKDQNDAQAFIDQNKTISELNSTLSNNKYYAVVPLYLTVEDKNKKKEEDYKKPVFFNIPDYLYIINKKRDIAYNLLAYFIGHLVDIFPKDYKTIVPSLDMTEKPNNPETNTEYNFIIKLYENYKYIKYLNILVKYEIPRIIFDKSKSCYNHNYTTTDHYSELVYIVNSYSNNSYEANKNLKKYFRFIKYESLISLIIYFLIILNTLSVGAYFLTQHL